MHTDTYHTSIKFQGRSNKTCICNNRPLCTLCIVGFPLVNRLQQHVLANNMYVPAHVWICLVYRKRVGFPAQVRVLQLSENFLPKPEWYITKIRRSKESARIESRCCHEFFALQIIQPTKNIVRNLAEWFKALASKASEISRAGSSPRVLQLSGNFLHARLERKWQVQVLEKYWVMPSKLTSLIANHQQQKR